MYCTIWSQQTYKNKKGNMLITTKERIFITVKTYPTKSNKYEELVCTAGIKENGEWIRLYPIPFRKMEEYKQFKRYTWIEVEIAKAFNDPRPDSKKINISSLKILENIGPDNKWATRKQLIFNNTPVYKNLETIISKANTENSMSLCTFKPNEFLKINIEKRAKIKDYTFEEKQKIKNQNRSLFDDELCIAEFTDMPEIPYNFKLTFSDDTGKESTMSIIDWEISQLFLKYEDEDEACLKVKEKLNTLIKTDLHLFLGTMRTKHGWANNPYTIIGLFYPPITPYYQPALF